MNNRDPGRIYPEHHYFKAFLRALGLEGSLRFLLFYEKWYVASPAAARKGGDYYQGNDKKEFWNRVAKIELLMTSIFLVNC